MLLRLQLFLVKSALRIIRIADGLRIADYPRTLLFTGVGFLSALLMTFLVLSSPKAVSRPPEGVLKADRLEPREVRVIPITRSLPIPAAALTPAEPEVTPRQRIAMADPLTVPVQDAKADRSDDNRPSLNRGRTSPDRGHSDICARSGGRRVELNHGRSWRCVYARR